MGFSRQEYWSRLPCPPSGDLPDPEIEPRAPALQADSLPLGHQGRPWWNSSMLSSGTALTSFSNFGSDSSGVYSDVWCEVWVQFYLFQLATTCLNIIYEIKAEKEREEPLVFSKRRKFTKVALWCLTGVFCFLVLVLLPEGIMSKTWPRDTPGLLNVIEFATTPPHPEFIGPNYRDRIWSSTFSFLKKKKIYLTASSLDCGMWDMVPWPEIEPRPLHWEHRVESLDHQGSPQHVFSAEEAGSESRALGRRAASPSGPQGRCRVQRLCIWWRAAEMKTRALCVCFSFRLWGGCWRRLQGLTWSISGWGHCLQEVKASGNVWGRDLSRALGMFLPEVLGEGPGMTDWPSVWRKLVYRAASRSKCQEQPHWEAGTGGNMLGKTVEKPLPSSRKSSESFWKHPGVTVTEDVGPALWGMYACWFY